MGDEMPTDDWPTTESPASNPAVLAKRIGTRRVRNLSIGAVALGVGVAGVFAWTQVKPVIESRKYASVTYEVPTAPKLTPAAGETLLRIDPPNRRSPRLTRNSPAKRLAPPRL